MLLCSTAEPQFRRQIADVFNLVKALWGKSEEVGGVDGAKGAYNEQSYRRRMLSSWLSEVNKRETNLSTRETDLGEVRVFFCYKFLILLFF